MVEDVVVVGAGGFGRETLDVIDAHNLASGERKLRVLGVADDAPSVLNLARLTARGVSHLGTIDEVLAAFDSAGYVIGVGNPRVRHEIALAFEAANWRPVTVTHPSATIGSASLIGAGSVICGGAQLSTNTRVGRHVHINPNAIIGHDSVIEDFVSVNPGAIVSGDVLVDRGVLIGAGAVVLQGLTLGRDGTVGAHACVTRSTDRDVTVVGIPARPIGKESANG